MSVGFEIYVVVFMTLRENWKSMIAAEFSDRVTSYLLCSLTGVGFCTRCNFHTKAYSISTVRMGIGSWCVLLYGGMASILGGIRLGWVFFVLSFFLSFSN